VCRRRQVTHALQVYLLFSQTLCIHTLRGYFFPPFNNGNTVGDLRFIIAMTLTSLAAAAQAIEQLTHHCKIIEEGPVYELAKNTAAREAELKKQGDQLDRLEKRSELLEKQNAKLLEVVSAILPSIQEMQKLWQYEPAQSSVT